MILCLGEMVANFRRNDNMFSGIVDVILHCLLSRSFSLVD